MNESEFRQLLDKYLQGKCTPEEVNLLHRFYESFPEEQTDQFDMWLSEKRIYKGIRQRISERERKQYRVRKMKSAHTYRLLKIAASVLLIIGIGLGGYFAYEDTMPTEIAWMEKVTQKGQRATITLMDGTKVYLNANSKISFPEQFSKDKREVVLEGEAFFEVTRNVERPFTIRSKSLTTTVLGTSFNIRSFEGVPEEVSVATGKVKVNPTNTADSAVFLIPNQQAYFDGHLSKKEIDIQEFIAWKDKIIRFDETTLAEAALVLENWFNVPVEFKNEELKNCKINGQYIDESLGNILESFKYILGIDYHFTDNGTLILDGKPCKSNT